MKLIISILFSLTVNLLIAQNLEKTNTDTIVLDSVKIHSPTKATLYSVAIPGLGQAYNKKYWKIPLIYGGIFTSIYFARSNHRNYKRYKTAYSNEIDGDINTVNGPEFNNYTPENLKNTMDFHQRNRDLSYIVAGLFYVLNIVDAAVDAHLFTFPKNDKLSFNLQPSIQLTQNNEITNGLKLVIKL